PRHRGHDGKSRHGPHRRTRRGLTKADMETTNPAALISACIQLTDEQLASSEREMADVRCILEDAIARLIRDRSSVTALQFQDISDQLLAHASGRLRSVRQEL